MNTEFFGSDKSSAAYEAIALNRIPLELRKAEADLYETKWFDYRLKHPVWATYYWASCYEDAAIEYCRIVHDNDRAEAMVLLPRKDVFQTRDATSAVRARQALDAIGCRYEWAMHFIVARFCDRGWYALPRPNQLYGEELTLDIADAWKTECATVLQIPRDDFFQGTENDLVRSKYYDFIEQQVRNRGTDTWRGVSRLVSEKVVPVQELSRRFGPEVLERALKVAR